MNLIYHPDSLSLSSPPNPGGEFVHSPLSILLKAGKFYRLAHRIETAGLRKLYWDLVV